MNNIILTDINNMFRKRHSTSTTDNTPLNNHIFNKQSEK